jgi:hypothetical protein
MADAPPPVPPVPGPQPVAPVPEGSQGRYSADGFWWWDGSNWRPAYSQDRLWRWNGQTWVPAQAAPAQAKGGSGLTIGLIVGGFVLVLVVVAVIVVVILGSMGTQLANVFSNVAAALGSPSP